MSHLPLSITTDLQLKAKVGNLSIRSLIIRDAIQEAKEPIVVVGDSITQSADLPATLCGHPVINAGVGGMNIKQGATLLPLVFADHRAYLIALALGANDVASPSIAQDYAALIEFAKRFAPRIVAVSYTSDAETSRQISVAAGEVPHVDVSIPGAAKTDMVHLNAKGYSIWLAALQRTVEQQCNTGP